MRKLITLILVIIGLNAIAAEKVEIGGYEYVIYDDGTCKICGRTGTQKSGGIHIPSSIEYEGTTYTVTEIGPYAFNGYTTSSVTIPSTIEKIDDGAFQKCTNITKFIIPSSVTYIGFGAFCECTSLTIVDFEDSEQPIEYGYDTDYPHSSMFENSPIFTMHLGREIVYKSASNTGTSPFYNQTAMESVSFSDALTTIGTHLFDGCTSLRSITLPANLEKIEDYAFYGCNLKNLTINSKLRTIGLRAFGTIENINIPSIDAWTNISIADYFQPLSSTTTLTLDGVVVTDIDVPSGCTRISANAFANYSYLKSVNLPATVQSIGRGAFQNCSALASINLENVKDIAEKAFYDNYNMRLKSENLTARHIGKNAFYDCVSLSDLQFSADTLTLEEYAFKYCIGLKSFKATSVIDTIPDHCFERCNALSTLSLPNTITVIGESAFNDCYSLTEFIGWPNLSKIEELAFGYCSSLSNVVLDGTNLVVDKQAFYHCTEIRTIQVNSGVKSIGEEAFNQTSCLESIQFKEGIETIGSKVFPSGDYYVLGNNSTNAVLRLPNSLKKIGNNAFLGNKDMQEIVFGDNLISYGSGNFATSPIKKITFNSGVEVAEPFNSSIERVLGDNVSIITKNMLSYWIGLTELVVPKGATSIDINAFDGCENFHKFIVPYGEKSLSLPAGLFTNLSLDSISINRPIADTTIDYFKNLTTLKYLNLAYAGIQQLPAYAFEGCENLKDIIVSRNTTNIGSYAFKGCANLDSICLPGAITQYGEYLFSGCSRLSQIILLSNTDISATSLKGLSKKVSLVSRNPLHYNGYSLVNYSYRLDIPAISYISLNVGEQNEMSLYGGLIPNAYFDWSATNVNIATVDGQGVISAVGTGKSAVQYRCMSDNSYSINVYSGMGDFPSQISIKPNAIQGLVGDKVQLSIKTIPEDALLEDIEYSVQDQSVASISDKQVVTLKAAGKTKITATTVNGLSATCTVEVYEKPTKVSIEPESSTINEGDAANFVITIQPTTANQLYNIVSISDNGTVLDSTQAQIATNDTDGGGYTLKIDNLSSGEHQIGVTTRNNLECSCSISVIPAISAIILSNDGVISLYDNETAKLSAKVSPDNAFDKNLTWEISDPSVAEVEISDTEFGYDSTINIKPLAVGTTNIVARSTYNSEIVAVGEIFVLSANAVLVHAMPMTMYYGDEVPELQYSVNGSELLGIPTISCSATSSSPVGTYDIILGIGTITNHTVELVNSTLTILPAPLVISVQDEERYYGENNPDFIVQYDGFKNYEDESIMQIIPQAVTTATQYSDCGMYPITITEAYAPNYDITYINGNLTINQASQQIKWEQEFDNVKVGDLIEIVFSTTTDLPITITSDNESVARITKLINDRTFVSIDDFGTSTITISQLGDQNYLPVEVSKLLTVSNASGMVDVEQSEPFELVGNVIHLNTYVRTRVYNLSGIMVYDGYDATIALQSGYYVIFIGIDKYKIKI